MEKIENNDVIIEFETQDNYTKEGTEYLTINIDNKITNEDISIWLYPEDVRELINRLEEFLED